MKNKKTIKCTITSAIAILTVLMAVFMLTQTIFAATVNVSQKGEKTYHVLDKQGSYLPISNDLIAENEVYIGFYPTTVYDIDFESNTFYATFYLWLTWKNADLDPTETLQLINEVDNWGTIITPTYEEPVEMDDGTLYQCLLVNGRFHQTFDLTKYPLDKQELSIYIEDSDANYDVTTYYADEENSGLDSYMTVPGWKILGLTSQTFIHDYVTNFGDISIEDGMASKYTCLKFSLEMERNAGFFIWKLLLPLMVVMITCWCALLLHAAWVDLRTAAPATALLTAIFLQSSYQEDLPQLSYLVLLDKIYVVAYVLVIFTMLEVIWVNHKLHMDGDEPIIDEEEGKKYARMDIISAGVQLVLFVLIVVLMVLLQ